MKYTTELKGDRFDEEQMEKNIHVLILTLTILSLAACSAAPPTAAPAAGAVADETAASAQG